MPIVAATDWRMGRWQLAFDGLVFLSVHFTAGVFISNIGNYISLINTKGLINFWHDVVHRP